MGKNTCSFLAATGANCLYYKQHLTHLCPVPSLKYGPHMTKSIICSFSVITDRISRPSGWRIPTIRDYLYRSYFSGTVPWNHRLRRTQKRVYLFWLMGYFSFKLLENFIFLGFVFCHGIQFLLKCFTWKIPAQLLGHNCYGNRTSAYDLVLPTCWGQEIPNNRISVKWDRKCSMFPTGYFLF